MDKHLEGDGLEREGYKGIEYFGVSYAYKFIGLDFKFKVKDKNEF